MGSFRAAILLSLARQAAAQSEEQKRLEAKRIQQAETERMWREELARREVDRLDLDGSRAAARAERDRQWEEDQLAEMAAMMVRQTKRR